MLYEVLILNLILCPLVVLKQRQKEKQIAESNKDLGGKLITALRNDANLDLSMDEEYEELRAELLAYHTALASLAEDSTTSENPHIVATSQPFSGGFRRSLKTTPCWSMGGICIHYKLCQGHKFLTETPGCKNNLEVCCFAWNKLETRNLRDKGINDVILPWSHRQEIGGQGLLVFKDNKTKLKKEDLKPRVLQVFDAVELAKRNDKEMEIIKKRRLKKQRFKKHNLDGHRNYDNKRNSHLLFILNP